MTDEVEEEEIVLTETEKREVLAFLGNKSVIKVLAKIQSEALSLDTLMYADLVTPEGIKRANEDKGMCRGLFRALDIFYEESKLEKKEEENDE